MPAAKLAEYHGLPAAYLAKGLQALAAADVVETGRGRVGGGYRLARPPEDITLLDIVDAVEGPGPAFRCAGIRFQGPCAADRSLYPPVCPITAAMDKADQAWRDALRSQTLAQIVSTTVETAVPEVLSSSVVWLDRAMR